MPLYRCFNPACVQGDRNWFDFWEEKPACPKCGASLLDPESCHLILALAPVHFDALNKWGRGKGVKACDGKPFGLEAGTGSPGVVTCPACKLTETWKRAAADSELEAVVEITPERAAALRVAAATTLRAKGGVEKTAVGN